MSDEKPKHDSSGEDTKPIDTSDIVVVPLDDCVEDEGDEQKLLGMARDGLELLLLDQAKWLYKQADEYRLMAQRPQRPFDDSCIEKSMRCSVVFLKFYEAFRKHRGRGEQKMIVEHHGVPASAERLKRDPRRAAPPTNAKRNVGKARAG